MNELEQDMQRQKTGIDRISETRKRVTSTVHKATDDLMDAVAALVGDLKGPDDKPDD